MEMTKWTSLRNLAEKCFHQRCSTLQHQQPSTRLGLVLQIVRQQWWHELIDTAMLQYRSTPASSRTASQKTGQKLNRRAVGLNVQLGWNKFTVQNDATLRDYFVWERKNLFPWDGRLWFTGSNTRHDDRLSRLSLVVGTWTDHEERRIYSVLHAA